MKSLGRSSTCPDDHFVADGDAVPVPVIPLSRSMSVRDAEEDRPTSVKSLGRSMSYKLYQKAVKADLMGRREEGVPSLSRSVGVVSLDRGKSVSSLPRSLGEGKTVGALEGSGVDVVEDAKVDVNVDVMDGGGDVKVDDATEVTVEVKDKEIKLIDI